MAILHLIHGYIGAGKTTFAKKLEAETGATRYTFDEWMIDMFGDNPLDFPGSEAKTKTRLSLEVQKNFPAKDLILDYGFWSRKERDEYRELGRSHGAEVILYSVVIDMDVAKKRTLLRTERKEKGALFVDENAFEKLKAEFEALDHDEVHVIVKST